MKIAVHLIPESGRTLSLDASQGWVAHVVRGILHKEMPDERTIVGELTMVRTEQNVNLSGSLEVTLHPTCDRCLESFSYPHEVPIQMNLAPLYATRKEEKFHSKDEEIELTKEDVEFGFYEGTEIDLAPILREILVLSLPLSFICSDSCRGLCPKCGSNLNEENHECN